MIRNFFQFYVYQGTEKQLINDPIFQKLITDFETVLVKFNKYATSKGSVANMKMAEELAKKYGLLEFKEVENERKE